MRKKGKLRCLMLVFLIGMMGFTACHGKTERSSFAIPQEFDTGREYEITFWAKNDTNVKQTRIYEKAIKDFETLYPNIKVNLRLYTDYGKIYNDVITNISTNTTPNVCITYPDHIATYLTGENTVVPLEELFADKNYGLGGSKLLFDSPGQKEIVPQFLEECIISGHYYALPYMRSTEACYINKTYVEKLGYTLPEELTWDFVREVSRAAMKKDENGNYFVNGQKVLIPFIYKSTDNMMIQILKQKGAGYSADNGEIEIFNNTTKEFLYSISDQVKEGTFSTFKISGYPANYLNAGQCIFAIDSTAGATWMGSNAPLIDISEENLVEFETVVMPIPQYNPKKPKMISQGPSVCVFNKEDPQEVFASWLFTQYLLTNEVQIAYAQTEGYVPVTVKAQESEEYQEYLAGVGKDNDLYYDIKIQASLLLLNHVGDTFVTPVFNGSASLRDAAGQMIENVAKSTRRKQVIDEAYMEKLYQDVKSLYRLEQHGSGNRENGKVVLGALPGTAVALLVTLGVTWVLILSYVFWEFFLKKKIKK